MAGLSEVLTWVGALWAVSLLFKLGRFVHLYIIRPSSLMRYHYHIGDKPPWALVTGASDGIGFACARELARRGFNVIIHGRNPTKLQGCKENLTKEFPQRDFRIATLDATVAGTDSTQQISALVESLKSLNLTILVNNAGGGSAVSPLFKTLDKHSPLDIDAMLNFNARFPVQLTAAILPLLLQHDRHALILNMGSVADNGCPYITTYAGSKAFDMAWSVALSREMKAEGRKVEVLGIHIANVTNVTFRRVKPTLTQPDGDTFAKAALDRVGCGRSVVCGYWVHGVVKSLIIDTLPDPLVGRIFTNAVMEEARLESIHLKRA